MMPVAPWRHASFIDLGELLRRACKLIHGEQVRGGVPTCHSQDSLLTDNAPCTECHAQTTLRKTSPPRGRGKYVSPDDSREDAREGSLACTGRATATRRRPYSSASRGHACPSDRTRCKADWGAGVRTQTPLRDLRVVTCERAITARRVLGGAHPPGFSGVNGVVQARR